ncbi:MAG: nucleotidyl transferase AbiEii/AbiGii toxin family protein [Bacteroidales bacterium]|nr:nucleotidyl transferase AbiEii/AbiGii toxin family protein [Bacteroidales bacterium]
MIDPRSRSLEWILESCHINKVSDPTLMEKAIRAFSLLEALARSGCPFLFKGGSALMLQLDCTQRLSVDIDIVCPPDTDVIAYLKPYAEEYGFGEIKQSERISRTNVPKTHAKCFYQVSYVTNTATEKILLDVLFEENWYTRIEQKPIVSPFLQMTGEPLMVNLPSKDDLLGDKLTAFAPSTTGIPYIKTVIGRGGLPEGRHCSMEIIKQLFDIASLFDRVNDLSVARATFEKIASIELDYRHMNNGDITPILDDIYKTSELICTGIYTKDQSFEYQELVRGINQIRPFIISEKFNHYSAIVGASKAAYLSVLLRKGINDIRHYDPAIDMRSVQLSVPVNPAINKIKTFRPEAFYYWTLIERILAE